MRFLWIVPTLAATLLSALPAQANELFGFIPTPGKQTGENDIRGPLTWDLGTDRLNSGKTLWDLNVEYHSDSPFALETRIAADPGDFMNAMITDVNFRFNGQTGTFLPLNLQPFMGLGAGMYLWLPQARTGIAAGTDSDIYMPIYAPLGIRYSLALGPVAIGAEATYYWELMDFGGHGSRFDASRWRYEATARLGFLSLGAYQETGLDLGGTGVRLGMNF